MTENESGYLLTSVMRLCLPAQRRPDQYVKHTVNEITLSHYLRLELVCSSSYCWRDNQLAVAAVGG